MLLLSLRVDVSAFVIDSTMTARALLLDVLPTNIIYIYIYVIYVLYVAFLPSLVHTVGTYREYVQNSGSRSESSQQYQYCTGTWVPYVQYCARPRGV